MVRQNPDSKGKDVIDVEKTEQPTDCCDSDTETHVTIGKKGNYKVVEQCSKCGDGKDVITPLDTGNK